MKEVLSTPWIQRLAIVLAAAGLYIAAAKVPSATKALEMLAAGLAGGAVIPRPGDSKKEDE